MQNSPLCNMWKTQISRTNLLSVSYTNCSWKVFSVPAVVSYYITFRSMSIIHSYFIASFAIFVHERHADMIRDWAKISFVFVCGLADYNPFVSIFESVTINEYALPVLGKQIPPVITLIRPWKQDKSSIHNAAIDMKMFTRDDEIVNQVSCWL